MSYSNGSRKEISETFSDFLTGCAKIVFYVGSGASLVAIALLVVMCFAADGATGPKAADALNNIALFQKLLICGMLGVGVGSGYLFWGEDLLGALQLLFSAALYFAPLYLPMVLGGKSGDAVEKSLAALQTGGTMLGVIAVPILVFDIVNRTRQRIKVGVKAESLRYGKGIKEETSKQNVFMGKCWQLPFCRKFVRERCPIYHSKRTCWKELVGCMCEEQVIRNAMENKPIPKDALLAGRMIPQNHKLTLAQKQERCRNCVIYNEHQRHKYKAAVPAVCTFFALFYAAFRSPLLDATNNMVRGINRAIQGATLNSVKVSEAPAFFVEVLLITFFIVSLSYAMKVLEYLIFKLKI
jgi:hypothetical protein